MGRHKHPVDPAGRTCTRCKIFKPWDDYTTDDDSPNGRKCRCKACMKLERVESTDWRKAWHRNRLIQTPWIQMHVASKNRSGHEHTITVDDVRREYEKCHGHCPVEGCGKEFVMGGGVAGRFSAPSLDRIDSRRGYTPDNIWVICFECNYYKRDMTPERLFGLARSTVVAGAARQTRSRLDIANQRDNYTGST